MKKRVWIVALLVFLLSAGTVLAETRASSQISSYTIAIGSKGTTVTITSEVSGTHSNLTRIGFSSVTIYERAVGTSGWTKVASHGPSYALNTGYHKYTVSYIGRSGYEYYGATNIYAEDSNGYTTRAMSSSACKI